MINFAAEKINCAVESTTIKDLSLNPIWCHVSIHQRRNYFHHQNMLYVNTLTCQNQLDIEKLTLLR